MNLSPSWIFWLILIAGLMYGLMVFSSTSYADVLRSLGFPIPYCTPHYTTSLAELDFTRFPVGALYEVNDVVAYISFTPREELVTALCTVSQNGANVRVIVSPVVSANRDFVKAMDECKVKLRTLDLLYPNILVAGRCVYTFGYDKDLVVCNPEFASKVKKDLEGVWSRAG